MKPLTISAFTSTSAAGVGLAALSAALTTRRGGLRACMLAPDLKTFTGEVAGLDTPLTGALARFDCRNNRLAQLALAQDDFAVHIESAREHYGPTRVAVILGTSTSGIAATEQAYVARDAAGRLPHFEFAHTHNLYATTDYVRAYFNLRGPAATVSTACSSSAKVFASAYRLMSAGLCDAAVVGGVDSLCRNTLYGFSALELVAPAPCRPCSADRGGISIGEAAGFALLEWPERAQADSGLRLLGYGESADAHHMSTPRPDGAGAALAMQRALASAELHAADIDYINMHGTASLVNDAMEDRAIAAVFGRDTACSATKGWTGHTLGAAGITEAAITCLALRMQMLPGTLNTDAVDPSFTSRVLLENAFAPVRQAMSNSFGFGGSNCSLIFGRAQ